MVRQRESVIVDSDNPQLSGYLWKDQDGRRWVRLVEDSFLQQDHEHRHLCRWHHRNSSICQYTPRPSLYCRRHPHSTTTENKPKRVYISSSEKNETSLHSKKGKLIQHQKSLKILVHTLTLHGMIADHVNKRIAQNTAALTSLYSFWHLSRKQKLHLMKALIRLIWNYSQFPLPPNHICLCFTGYRIRCCKSYMINTHILEISKISILN